MLSEPPAQNLLIDVPSTRNARLKKPRLGRYENVRRKLESSDFDTARVFVEFSERIPKPNGFQFIDLFCGAGGMTCGLSRAGYTPRAAVEIVDIACDTHHRNFPLCELHRGPIQDFDPKTALADMGEIHLVSGGPPCQGFSVAGFRRPEDERNQLFREFMRVVKAVQPWYVVMENVPGILTLAGGAFYRDILAAFAEAGYPTVSVAILESADYGIPQLRPRAIFIANRFGRFNPYPQPQLAPGNYQPIEAGLRGLPADERIPEINHEWTKHSKAMEARLAKVPPGGSLYETFFDAWKRQYPGLPSMTIKENHGGTHVHPHLNRVLSAREMARLQTFPDDFIFCGSMKKAMWQIGNAVPPRLAEVIGKALYPSLRAIADNAADPCMTNSDWKLLEKKV
ncbi:MAG: DNA cytosine methyltransferase [Verrucomicrobia bacterium]|nr:DNA cytosine methyltransferase [Verrucomicrobiota bacterium]